MKKRARQRETSPDDEACRAMAQVCLSANLRKTERLVTRHYDSYLADSGVSAVQLPIIAMINTMEEPTFRAISESLDLDRSTLSRNLSVLKQLELVSIGPSSGPKPGEMALTRKGREALRRAHKRWIVAHAALEKTLSTANLASGLGFLKRLRRGTRTVRDTRESAPKRKVR